MKRLTFHGERKNEEIIGQKLDNNIYGFENATQILRF